MDPSRIAELLKPFLTEPCHAEAESEKGSAVLSPIQLNAISTYIDILQRWNQRLNLTAIRNEEEMVTRHFGESLFAARSLFPTPSASSAMRVADVGSGAGFPGIPFKLWAPDISLTLIESNHKKATFLREVARALTLTNIDIQNRRAESLSNSHFDVVTMRAVERFESILPIAASLLAPDGRLALLLGHSQLAKAQSVSPDLTWEDPFLVPASESRLFVIARSPISPKLPEPS